MRLGKSIMLVGIIPLAGFGSARGALFDTNQFATQVTAYTQGSVAPYDAGYSDTADWTGIPTGYTGAPEGFPGVITPFFPPFDTSQILVFGNGGHLTLQFPSPVYTGGNFMIGVYSTCGFVDSSGNGTVANSAATFGGGLTKVQVSADGVHWFSLGVQNINMPQSYYENSGPYDVVVPSDPLYSDYGLPYTGGLAAFANESDSQVIATLNGSAGGTWIDLSSTGLSQIEYVDFSPPPSAPADWQIAIEAVSTQDPAMAPEPSGVSALVGGITVGLLKRRRSRELP